ncbi:MAG: O-antigen ligase family protein [Verrucomicrobiales bacterium]|nr:O-antigen ligase family protein [Verrucomicrobiales bacterium]
MFRELGLPAWVAIYLVAIPLAIIVGVSVADPASPTSLLVLAMIIGVGLLPLAMRYYHESLILCWNSALVVFFLPGRPTIAMVLTGITLGMAVVKRAMLRQPISIPARTIAAPLIIIGLVVFATALLTGGIGGRALGGDMWGARRYAGVFVGVFGFFALSSMPIPQHKAMLLAGLFTLSGTTAAASDLAYALDWNYLFLLFSTELAFLQAAGDQIVGSFVRFTGVCWAAWAVFNFMLMRYGLRGLIDFSRPWRFLFAAAALFGTLMGGYRSYIILTALLCGSLFFLEGLHRTKVPLIALVCLALGSALILPNTRLLPLAVQRSLSVLPFLDVDPVARRDAQGTLDWRLEMWKTVLPEVPRYLLLGKGFAYSGTDYYLTQEAVRRGMIYKSYEDAIISGNYHNGILTVIIPFGIWGTVAFGWFCIASVWALLRNYRYGDPSLAGINRFMLASFLTRLVFYLTVYGQFDLDLQSFVGLVGMSVALNAGIRGPVRADQRASRSRPSASSEPGMPQPATA